MGSNPVRVTKIWEYSSAGRALALQARGHRFEPCCSHQRRGEAIFAKDCLSDGLFAFTLAAPFPKKFYNFLGSLFLRHVVTTKKVCKKCKPFLLLLLCLPTLSRQQISDGFCDASFHSAIPSLRSLRALLFPPKLQKRNIALEFLFATTGATSFACKRNFVVVFLLLFYMVVFIKTAVVRFFPCKKVLRSALRCAKYCNGTDFLLILKTYCYLT